MARIDTQDLFTELSHFFLAPLHILDCFSLNTRSLLLRVGQYPFKVLKTPRYRLDDKRPAYLESRLVSGWGGCFIRPQRPAGSAVSEKGTRCRKAQIPARHTFPAGTEQIEGYASLILSLSQAECLTQSQGRADVIISSVTRGESYSHKNWLQAPVLNLKADRCGRYIPAASAPLCGHRCERWPMECPQATRWACSFPCPSLVSRDLWNTSASRG